MGDTAVSCEVGPCEVAICEEVGVGGFFLILGIGPAPDTYRAAIAR